MAKRFSRIKQAPRLQQAYTAYNAWRDTVKPYQPRGAGSSPGGFANVEVLAFGLEGTDKIKVKVSRRARTAIGSEIAARAADATPTAKRMPGLSPAKIVVFRGTGTATTARSEITNLEYQKRAGASYTHAFGGNTATEKEFEAQEILINAFIATAGTSVTFVPERLYQV